IREVAGPLFVGRDRGQLVAELALAKLLVRDEEKRLVPLDGTADGAAKLIPLKARERHAAAVVEEIVRVEHRVAWELIRAAVPVIAARFVDQVQNTRDAAAKLRRVVLRLHLELGDCVYGWEHGQTRKSVHRREVRRRAVYERRERASTRAVDAVAD